MHKRLASCLLCLFILFRFLLIDVNTARDDLLFALSVLWYLVFEYFNNFLMVCYLLIFSLYVLSCFSIAFNNIRKNVSLWMLHYVYVFVSDVVVWVCVGNVAYVNFINLERFLCFWCSTPTSRFIFSFALTVFTVAFAQIQIAHFAISSAHFVVVNKSFKYRLMN